MNTGLCITDYAVIVAFFATMVGVGLWSSRRASNAGAYFGKDRSASWWLSGISFYMNSFSALAFVMYSALAYKYGFLPVTVSWLLVPSIMIASRWLAVRWRRAAQKSPIDFIARRYTPKMCSFVAWCGLPMQALDNALKLLAVATVVAGVIVIGLTFVMQYAQGAKDLFSLSNQVFSVFLAPITLPMQLFTTVTAAVLLVIGSWLFPDKPDERASVEGFFRQIELSGGTEKAG